MKPLKNLAIISGLTLAVSMTLSGCNTTAEQVATESATEVNNQQLNSILAAQPDEVKARYQYRNPKETLEFFGIKPGMTVVEALPGGGWYSKILAPYLGNEGHLIGANYSKDLWPKFAWASEEFIAGRIAATDKFPAQVKEWVPENTPKVSSYTFATFPQELTGTVDAALYVRALHNLNRFDAEHQFMQQALKETHRILKPDGVVGIVQHSTTNAGADGETGYLVRDDLINSMDKAGFVLVASSDINANPKDQPAADESVWRLPPTYYTSKDDAKLKQKYAAIGESNRMTLLFKKK